MSSPTLVIGSPGLGKSTALRRLAAEGDAAYCEVTQHTNTPKGIYKMLLEAFGIPVHRHFIYELGEQCYRQLRAAGRVLLVDEYQTLKPLLLRELLSVQERTGLAMVLCGNKERLAGTPKDAAALAQIENRIGWRERLERPTPADCERIGVEFNVEGKAAYAALVRYGGNTTVRDLVRLLKLCANANEGSEGGIQLHHIETAILGIYGRRSALKLLSADVPSALEAA